MNTDSNKLRKTITAANNFSTITPQEFTAPDMSLQIQRRKISPAWVAVLSLALVVIILLTYLRLSTAVLITITPIDAEFELTGFAPKIASSYLLLSGRYQINASAEGYHVAEEEILVSGEDSLEYKVILVPLPGRIDVKANVDSLQVAIDGLDNETALPGTLVDVERGQHQLIFSSYRYFSQTVDLLVEGFDHLQELNLEFEPAWGQLQLTSVPAGANVIIDGKSVGQTPLLAEILQTGSYVEISKEGFNPWQQSLSVTAGQSEVFDPIEMTPADGLINIVSKPTGATLTIDGNFAGQTPFQSSLTSLKNHQLTLFSQGYQTLKRKVSLQPAEQLTLELKLRPQLGDVQLRVKPAQASVYIDGKLQGTGDQTMTLVASEHLLEVRLDGYVSQQQNITPKEGLVQSLSVKLLTKQQNYWAQFPVNESAPAGIEIVLMRPDATFKMGSSRREPGRRSNETIRNVQINKPFYIGRYEVTNNQYRQFVREHNSLQIAAKSLNFADQPAVNISWIAAAAFCNWLSLQDNLKPVYTIAKDRLSSSDLTANGYRLPTEAEWAWVARVEPDNSLRRYIWGKQYPPKTAAANYADVSAQGILGRSVPGYQDGHTVTAPVGSYSADAKGLFDIAGNVSEWMHDYYSIVPNSGEAQLNPGGPATGRDHVIRGAGWRHGSRTEIRLSYRNFGGKGEFDLGFRIVRNIE